MCLCNMQPGKHAAVDGFGRFGDMHSGMAQKPGCHRETVAIIAVQDCLLQ